MKKKILNILSQSGDFISGEKISRELGISRSAVWKHVRALKNEGHKIISVTNRGYKLTGSHDIITPEAIQSGLNTQFIGKTIFCYDETDSTNTRAKLESSAPDGSLFIAEIQNSGKGRTGKSWTSPKGDGIWMSLLLKPDISPDKVSQITLAAGLAVCLALGTGAMIKWPNDIVMGTKKICGILTEMSAEIDRVNYIVCGIGINVNTRQFTGELSEKATSLYIEMNSPEQDGDSPISRAPIVRRVLEEFEPLYLDFLENGLKNILPLYKPLCLTLNREVNIISKNESFTAAAVDIDQNGALIVSRDGEKVKINSGEVSVRGIYGYI